MAYDKFLIAPFESGLDKSMSPFLLNASSGMIERNTKGCVMAREYKRRKDIIDETGNRHGMLLVIEPYLEGKGRRSRGVHWKCLCDCGNYCTATGSGLREGKRKSCGCLREKTIETTGLNYLMRGYSAKSWQARRVFNLSKEVFYKLIKGNCHYCGAEPSQIIRRNKSKHLVQIIYNGIDRVDNSKPYIPSNCVTCCKRCNRAKSDLTIDQFKDLIRRLHSWLLTSIS